MSTTNLGGNKTAATNNVLFSNDNKGKTTNKKAIPVTVVIPNNEKENSLLTEPVEVQQQTAVQEQPQPQVAIPVQKPILTIREMQEKAAKMHILSEKYNNLCGKRQNLDIFSISHDGDSARMILTDAKGQRFESSNPICIRQLIDLWKKIYTETMQKIEQEMRELLEA